MTTDLVSQVQTLHADAFGWALHCCEGDFCCAEDVLQLAYAKLVRGRLRFGGESALKTWWFGVIRLTSLEERRRQIFRHSLFGRLLLAAESGCPTPVATPQEKLETDERAMRLLSLLKRLPARQAEVLHLVFYQDLSIANAAKVMKVSLGSARTHYERGKSALRTLIQQEEEELHESAR